MVSPMGGNVGDDKGWDEKVISNAMEVSPSDIGYGKYGKCLGVWNVMCKFVGV